VERLATGVWSMDTGRLRKTRAKNEKWKRGNEKKMSCRIADRSGEQLLSRMKISKSGVSGLYSG